MGIEVEMTGEKMKFFTVYPAMIDIVQKHLSLCNTLSITLFPVLSAGICERGVGDQYWRRR